MTDNKKYEVIKSILDVPFDKEERAKQGIIEAITPTGTIWLKEVEPVEQWISVENLPKEKEIVLLYHPTRDRYQQGYLHKGHWIVNSFDVLPLINFTHWQPLLSPPKSI